MARYFQEKPKTNPAMAKPTPMHAGAYGGELGDGKPIPGARKEDRVREAKKRIAESGARAGANEKTASGRTIKKVSFADEGDRYQLTITKKK